MEQPGADSRTLAEFAVDVAEIWFFDVPQPLPEWQRRVIEWAFPEPAPEAR